LRKSPDGDQQEDNNDGSVICRCQESFHIGSALSVAWG
jgi:hypothetical protein